MLRSSGATLDQVTQMMSAGFAKTLADVLQISTDPGNATTVMSNSNTTIMLINNSSLLLALTITLPPTPVDMQRFTVACNAAITAMTITGGTVRGALAGLAVGGFMTFRYSQTLGLWFRTA